VQQCGVGEGETRSTRASGASDSDKTAVRVTEKRGRLCAGGRHKSDMLSGYRYTTSGPTEPVADRVDHC
jgi:hypothetical protein